MAGVFTAINIGTSHDRFESNNTMAKLFGDMPAGQGFINDGPATGGNWASNLMGLVAGHSMDRRCREAVNAILAARPHTVNLAGHSRGGVMCHMIAGDLNGSSDDRARAIQTINIIVLDPVDMSSHVHRGHELRTGLKQGWYVSVVMENESSPIFPSATVDPMDDQFRTSAWLHMPGSHGSGTQPLTSAIGLSCYLMIKRCLHAWGTPFSGAPPTARELSEAFAGIHLQNPVRYDDTGLVKSRFVSDDPKGQGAGPAGLKFGWKPAGRTKKIEANYERMNQAGLQADNLRNSPYFFNTFHMACFAQAFPAIYSRFGNSAVSQPAVDLEIQDITTNCGNVAASLMQLGMI